MASISILRCWPKRNRRLKIVEQRRRTDNELKKQKNNRLICGGKSYTYNAAKKEKEKWKDIGANQSNFEIILCADNRRRSLKLYRKNNENHQKRTQQWAMPEKKHIRQNYRQWKIERTESDQPLDCWFGRCAWFVYFAAEPRIHFLVSVFGAVCWSWCCLGLINNIIWIVSERARAHGAR